MKRNELSEIARQSILCFQQGYYMYGEKQIPLVKQHAHSLASCTCITEDESDHFIYKKQQHHVGKIIVENVDIIQAIASSEKKYGVLNFASAYHPGGGFLNGSLAQEESLCFGSNVYLTQICFQKAFYEYHQSIKTKCYSDRMIYSKDVVYIRDEQYAFLPEPKLADIITSPAVNLGVALSRGEDAGVCDQVMKKRMRKILLLFHQMGNQNIILGAYGCGVFRNDPKRVAQIWKELLVEEGLREAFDEMLFAVYDRSKSQNNIQAFHNILGTLK